MRTPGQVHIEYGQVCEQWDEQACPKVICSDGKLPTAQSVSHPGMKDERAIDNARMIVGCWNSYDKNCGEAAVDCAEADLLGMALDACEAAYEDCLTDQWEESTLAQQLLAVLKMAGRR